jgi:predicted nucleic acid-binding protein
MIKLVLVDTGPLYGLADPSDQFHVRAQKEAGDYKTAVQRVLQYPDQDITLFDAVTASLGSRLKVMVWTFDRHFDLMRAARWK